MTILVTVHDRELQNMGSLIKIKNNFFISIQNVFTVNKKMQNVREILKLATIFMTKKKIISSVANWQCLFNKVYHELYNAIYITKVS